MSKEIKLIYVVNYKMSYTSGNLGAFYDRKDAQDHMEWYRDRTPNMDFEINELLLS
jgi:hypothetical protein